MLPTAADKIDSDSEMSDPVLALMGVPGDEERAEELRELDMQDWVSNYNYINWY